MKMKQPVLRSRRRQTGATLMETMIALALSAVVVSGMVVLMGNSLGTATRIIHMSQLSDELRNAMSMMTRDVRRANYTAHSIFCYGNSRCGYVDHPEGRAALQVSDIQINVDRDCVSFALDRGFNGDATDDGHGGFRLVEVNGRNVIEMWTGAGGVTPNCAAAAGAFPWVPITDPDIVNITIVEVNDDGSIIREIAETRDTTFDSRQREIQIIIEGELVVEQARGNSVVSRRIEDTIYVRNDFVIPAS